MTEAEWNACTDPTPMLAFLRGKVSDRKSRLFAVACCRRVWHLLLGEPSRTAVEVAERYADGAATEEELRDTRDGAWEFADHTVNNNEAFFDLDDAALDAADAPAWASEWDTEWAAEPLRTVIATQRSLGTTEAKPQAELVRFVFGNPFHPISVDPSWLRFTLTHLAEAIYRERAFDHLPVLADALEDTGCTNQDILNHCRQSGEHCRGCWVVDLLLGKE